MLQYVAQLCSTLWVDNDFSGKAWTPCVVPYLTCFLPAEESAAACESFRYKEEKRSEAERMLKLGLDPEEDMGPEICNIYFSLAYGGKVLLHNTHLFLHRGKKYGLLGHNGAGKTSTFAVLTGLYPPTSGDCFVLGHSIRHAARAAFQLMGICPQHDVLWYELSAADHLALFAGLSAVEPAKIPSLVAYFLEAVDLVEARKTPCGKYSGGMRRRLSVACALIADPRVVYLDEPTTGMDPVNRRGVWDVIEKAKKNRVVVLTTQGEKTQKLRLPFPRPAEDRKAVKTLIIEMTIEAEKALKPKAAD